MKIDRPAPASPSRLVSRRPSGSGPAGLRHDNSFHTPDRWRVDAVIATPADPDEQQPVADTPALSREDAMETALEVGAWLAGHSLAIANRHAGRLHHLFID
ncbi:hypothetical protein [Maricaulis sp.]|uniref:hypothetical protein n=1 Tax=Maricaulis sp. TaxID=1486257 RepID=UPI002627C193|nr:hypothetical protein [Maricaulis sp.]